MPGQMLVLTLHRKLAPSVTHAGEAVSHIQLPKPSNLDFLVLAYQGVLNLFRLILLSPLSFR